jgi:triosephosphate isomerase
MQMGLDGAREYARRLAAEVPASPVFDMVIFPPFFGVADTAGALAGTPVDVGAQDLFWEKEGAFTGEVSGDMIAEAGGTHVIVGHSERRHVIGEDNSIIRRKLEAGLAAGLVVVLCVGEKLLHREAGEEEGFVEEQLETALAGLDPAAIKRIVIAYEPVWAIGTGKTATPEDAVAMHTFIRGFVERRFGADAAATIRILYGGSVKPDNAARLLGEEEIDGALVGGASLKIESFLQIANAVS